MNKDRIKEKVRASIIQAARVTDRDTYAKMHVGQMIKYTNPKDGWNDHHLTPGDKLVIVGFPPKEVQAYGGARERFLLCLDINTGKEVGLVVDQVLPLPFVETLELFA